MPKLNFRTNLDADYDPTEPEIVVEFHLTPGSKGWQGKHAHDPDRDPPCVEDIVVEDAKEGHTYDDLPDWVMAGIEQECWNCVDETYSSGAEPRRGPPASRTP